MYLRRFDGIFECSAMQCDRQLLIISDTACNKTLQYASHLVNYSNIVTNIRKLEILQQLEVVWLHC